ncbi:carboxymuconolactone decarboxylase family protein [Rhodococcus opacus]|uniref:carboxymuconolactone decarboxylase family protein n=1 Tax=Rhodococcus opacus TaxID=37919 RepID=UPI002235F48C|nr:carboxymuconolactone decarboxylase family protein [Rhodococcus opacus]UZG60502.1 carboxymuconolactone decarboxylase family protein [Rhodococcus opacus]
MKAAPSAMKSLMGFHQTVMNETDSSLDSLTKELIAVGIAVTTQCPYCIEVHVKGAREAGADEAQVAAAAMISSLVNAGGSMAHGWMAMKIMDEA